MPADDKEQLRQQVEAAMDFITHKPNGRSNRGGSYKLRQLFREIDDSYPLLREKFGNVRAPEIVKCALANILYKDATLTNAEDLCIKIGTELVAMSTRIKARQDPILAPYDPPLPNSQARLHE